MKLDLEQIKEKIESLYYWDARVVHLSSDYFGDEITLIYDDDEDYVIYRFLECYKSDFSHLIDYPKDIPYKDLTSRQIPFFMQAVDIRIDIKDEKELYIFNINAHPLYLEIWCKDVDIYKQKKEECDMVKLKK